MICADCRFSIEMPMGIARTNQRLDLPSQLPNLTVPVRLCRRYPRQMGQGYWTEVGDDEWCGEYEEAE